MINNKKIGNKCESKILDMLGKKGYWCTFLATKVNGQPCDIIAIKNNIGWLIDAKHCDTDIFYFRNIEPNQRTSFALANELGNTNTGFIIYFEKYEIMKWLEYKRVLIEESKGRKGVAMSECEEIEILCK